MKTDPQDAGLQKQKEISYTTEEEREKALVKLMAKIIVANVLKKGREQFPSAIEEDHGD